MGSASVGFELCILAFIMIQLMILDDNGMKHVRLSDMEDTSSAFVRMKLNRIFERRLKENLQTKVLYLKALFGKVQEMVKKFEEILAGPKADVEKSQPSSGEGTPSNRKHNAKPLSPKIPEPISPMSPTKQKIWLKSKIPKAIDEGPPQAAPPKNIASDLTQEDIDRLIDEEENNQKKHMNDILVKTLPHVERKFLEGFIMFTPENKSRFAWQIFSVYTRKPGLDLSIPIVVSQVLL